MNIRDLLPLVVDNLRRMKGRVALTALGVVIGTAALVILISLGAGLERQSSEFTSGSSLTEIHLAPRVDYRIVQGAELAGMTSDAPPSRCGSPMEREPLVDDALLAQLAALPGVEWVAVYEQLMATGEFEYGPLRGSGSVWGIEDGLLEQLGLHAARGTSTLERGQAVIGAEFAASLYDPAERQAADYDPQADTSPPPDLLGETLTLRLITLDADGAQIERAVRVEVVGVLAPQGWLYDQNVYVPQRDVIEFNTWLHGSRAGGRRDPARQGYGQVIVKAVDIPATIAVEEALKEIGFSIYTERQQLEEWAVFFRALQVFLGSLGAISLLVAAFGISNTMLMAIHERTREIGLLKAIGASNRDVLLIFVGESACIGMLGGLGGVTIGLLLNLVTSLGGTIRVAGLPATGMYTPPWLPLFGVLFAGLIGVVSGIYPAGRAARMMPIVALKYE